VLVVSLLAVGLVGLFGYGLTRDPYVLPSPLVGKSAPELGLPVMPPEPDPALGRWEGRDTVRMEELAGHPLVVNFWASWCLACREEHPHLSAAARRYRGEGVRFFGVLYQDKPPAARRFIRELGGQSYPTLLDPGSRVALDYGVYGVPETYFIGADGRVKHRHVGPVTRDLLRTRIDSLLAEKRRTGSASSDTSIEAPTDDAAGAAPENLPSSPRDE
jgi:cytochrome c biogenesis protein CcmG/thiol:disulfide interchange protein DsbE